jgi:hypothetical protein
MNITEDKKQGTIGFIIGKKSCLMVVDNHGDLLWQICVRELYILLKYYNSNLEILKNEFLKLIIIKKNQNLKKKLTKDFLLYCDLNNINELEDINKLLENKNKIINDDDYIFSIENILKFINLSFINILDIGYFLNNGLKKEKNYNFIIDFNNEELRYYKKTNDGKIINYEKIKILDILNFDDMPEITYNEIIKKNKDRFDIYYDKLLIILREKDNINKILKNNLLDNNIINGAKKMLDKINDELYIHNKNYRYFFNRLNDLELIDG